MWRQLSPDSPLRLKLRPGAQHSSSLDYHPPLHPSSLAQLPQYLHPALSRLLVLPLPRRPACLLRLRRHAAEAGHTPALTATRAKTCTPRSRETIVRQGLDALGIAEQTGGACRAREERDASEGCCTEWGRDVSWSVRFAQPSNAYAIQWTAEDQWWWPQRQCDHTEPASTRPEDERRPVACSRASLANRRRARPPHARRGWTGRAETVVIVT